MAKKPTLSQQVATLTDENKRIKAEYEEMEKGLKTLEGQHDLLTYACDNAAANLQILHKVIKYPEVEHAVLVLLDVLKKVGYIKE
jgi:hypothetical protein